MDNPVLYQVGIGVLTLSFFFLMYMFTRTWRWLHVTLMFFVYCAAVAFFVYAGMSLKTQAAWGELHSELTERAAKAKAEHERLLYGDRTALVSEDIPVRELRARLARTTLDRGRVWTGCKPAGPPAADGSITLSITAPVAPPGEGQGLVLYAFTEGPVSAELAPPLAVTPVPNFPQYYISEFSVTAAAPDSVTMRPSLPPTQRERGMMTAFAGATWALYEVMPLDGHQLFAEDPEGKPDLTKSATEEPVFGDIDENKMLLRLARAAQVQGETVEQFKQRYAEVLDEYTRDGRRAAETDPPENRWLKVRFTDAYEVAVDSEAELDAVVSSEDFFDRGRSEIPLLRRGKPGSDNVAKFKKDDIGVFPPEDANRMIAEGVCELVEYIYVRDLRNYDYIYRQIYRRLQRLAVDRRRLERNKAAMEAATARVNTTAAYRQQERDKLAEDKTRFEYERDEIKKYHETLSALVAQRRAELSELYRNNYQLATELVRLQRELTEEINRKTREAVANTP